MLRPAARLDIGVPDARFVADAVGARRDRHRGGQLLDPRRALRPARRTRAYDDRGVPLWIWNAHHTMFDAESLRAAVAEHLVVDDLFTYDIRNLRAATAPSAHPADR